MKVNPYLSVISDEKTFILYSPRTGSVLRVSGGVISALQKTNRGERTRYNPDVKGELIKTGILVEDFQIRESKPKILNPSRRVYAPTSATLMPTWDCNLRCVYCYSRGGENAGEPMEFEVAKGAIDFIVRNALDIQSPEIGISFHGGGEPLMPQNKELVMGAISYLRKQAKENNLKSRVSSATNGLISRRNLEWITRNLNSVNISLDGPEDIQNSQRPAPNGKPSFQG